MTKEKKCILGFLVFLVFLLESCTFFTYYKSNAFAADESIGKTEVSFIVDSSLGSLDGKPLKSVLYRYKDIEKNEFQYTGIATGLLEQKRGEICLFVIGVSKMEKNKLLFYFSRNYQYGIFDPPVVYTDQNSFRIIDNQGIAEVKYDDKGIVSSLTLLQDVKLDYNKDQSKIIIFKKDSHFAVNKN